GTHGHEALLRVLEPTSVSGRGREAELRGTAFPSSAWEREDKRTRGTRGRGARRGRAWPASGADAHSPRFPGAPAGMAIPPWAWFNDRKVGAAGPGARRVPPGGRDAGLHPLPAEDHQALLR